MSELVVVDHVGSESEAVLVCSILRDAGVQCMHRVTNFGSGAMDGLATGGPREIVVRAEQLGLARDVLDDQQNGPPPGHERDSRRLVAPPDLVAGEPLDGASTGAAPVAIPSR